jgi:hypothetical protein
MRFVQADLELHAQFFADGLCLAHHVAARARVGPKRQMSSSVAWVSALIGLKLRLPQTLSQISERMSPDTGALNPAALKASPMARTRGVSLPSISPR